MIFSFGEIRIMANRQSVMHSKEQKLRCISEMEHKVQTLQNEATTPSAQLTLLQRASAGFTGQINGLKFLLQPCSNKLNSEMVPFSTHTGSRSTTKKTLNNQSYYFSLTKIKGSTMMVEDMDQLRELSTKYCMENL
ncbi:hypothetical protein RND81_07G050600 [Saponaria officinalis]|uniref:Uncharacterized protein n=1 Tax=Saponaria officinalis TaxID=3572 RepID=A0AAW1JKL1_SAPOF